MGEFVDGRVVQFWNCRRESNCHMAKRWGCCEVEPPSELLFYVPEFRLANLRTGWLLHGTEFSRLSDPECHHPGPTGRCHTASDWPSERPCIDWPHCRRFPAASYPRNTCFGIRLPGKRIMWPTHQSCALNRKASIPVIPQVFNTSVLGVLSCHLTRAIFRRQRRWNWSNMRNGLIAGKAPTSHTHTAMSSAPELGRRQSLFSGIRHARPTVVAEVYQKHRLP